MIPNNKYKEAKKLLNNKKYEQAAKEFNQLKGFLNSEKYLSDKLPNFFLSKAQRIIFQKVTKLTRIQSMEPWQERF